MPLTGIAALLNNTTNIAVLPHVAADGDALGSSLALALALTGIGKKVKVILEEPVPQVYSFLPGLNLSEVYDGKKEVFDAAVALDTGDTGRLGKRLEIFEEANATVNIDHHTTNTKFAVQNYLDTESAAVGEIIFDLLKLMGLNPDCDISTCIYAAIATDTGGFKYSNTTPKTHITAAELIRNGVNVAEVSQLVFDSTSYEKVRLLGTAIEALELLEDGKVALIALTNDMIRRTGAKEEDCDGIVNIGRNIRGVKVAAMLRQWENGEVKANLRSSSEVDVAAIAAANGGGGHKKAAGYTVRGSLDEVKNKLLDDIRKVL